MPWCPTSRRQSRPGPWFGSCLGSFSSFAIRRWCGAVRRRTPSRRIRLWRPSDYPQAPRDALRTSWRRRVGCWLLCKSAATRMSRPNLAMWWSIMRTTRFDQPLTSVPVRWSASAVWTFRAISTQTPAICGVWRRGRPERSTIRRMSPSWSVACLRPASMTL